MFHYVALNARDELANYPTGAVVEVKESTDMRAAEKNIAALASDGKRGLKAALTQAGRAPSMRPPDDSGHMPVWTGQRVERTNARGHRRYVPAFKAWIVEQALVPSMSVAGLAMHNQVNANQLRRWVTLRQRAGSVPAPTLLPVTVAAPTSPSGARDGQAIEFAVAGGVVRVRSGVDAATLRTVFEVLRGMTT